MNIPDTLKVGGSTYKVSIVPDIMDSANPDGRIRFSSQTIEVKETASHEFMQKVFLHEMIHAIHEHIGLVSADVRPREDEVDALANALHMVIQDNPRMFERRYEPAAKG